MSPFKTLTFQLFQSWNKYIWVFIHVVCVIYLLSILDIVTDNILLFWAWGFSFGVNTLMGMVNLAELVIPDIKPLEPMYDWSMSANSIVTLDSNPIDNETVAYFIGETFINKATNDLFIATQESVDPYNSAIGSRFEEIN
jgi:hypothetical protein